MKNKIGQLWRLVGTGISFGVFGLGGLILGLLLFPILLLAVRDPLRRQAQARRIIARCFAAFVWLMKTLGVLTYEVVGDATQAPKENCLVVANHPTLIDVVFLIALFPHADCVVKSAMWRNPFTRGAVSAANYISNNGGPEVIQRCVSRLRSGSSLILFPEGTRTVPQVPPVFRPGAAAVATRAASRLQPVLINCQPLTLYKSDIWYNTPAQKPFFRFEILPVLRIEDLVMEPAGSRQQRLALNAALQQYFRARLATRA